MAPHHPSTPPGLPASGSSDFTVPDYRSAKAFSTT